VIAKRLLRTRKEYGVSAEELRELIHSGRGRIANWTGHHYPFKDYSPRIIVKNTLKNAVVQKDTFIYHDVLAKKLNILLLKGMELLLRN
jgi:hypothetical protein